MSHTKGHSGIILGIVGTEYEGREYERRECSLGVEERRDVKRNTILGSYWIFAQRLFLAGIIHLKHWSLGLFRAAQMYVDGKACAHFLCIKSR